VTAGLWVSDPCSAALTSLAVGCRVVEGFGWLPRPQRAAAKMSLQVIRSGDPIGVAVAVLVHRAVASQAAAASSAAMVSTIGV
jgi:hypothetical protein